MNRFFTQLAEIDIASCTKAITKSTSILAFLLSIYGLFTLTSNDIALTIAAGATLAVTIAQGFNIINWAISASISAYFISFSLYVYGIALDTTNGAKLSGHEAIMTHPGQIYVQASIDNLKDVFVWPITITIVAVAALLAFKLIGIIFKSN